MKLTWRPPLWRRSNERPARPQGEQSPTSNGTGVSLLEDETAISRLSAEKALEQVIVVLPGELEEVLRQAHALAGCSGALLLEGEGSEGKLRALYDPERGADAVYINGAPEPLRGRAAVESARGLFVARLVCLGSPAPPP